MRAAHIGLALELGWPLRRHLDVFAGIHDFAREGRGWTFEIDEFLAERLRGPAGRKKPFDGLLARATPELAAAARRARIPLVNVWFNSPARKELPGVFPDLEGIGRMAAEHLADRGFRRFACLGPAREEGHRLLAGAFHRVVGGLGCRCTCAVVPREYQASAAAWSRFQETLGAWIGSWSSPVGVLVSFFDATARYVVDACQRRGLRVPEDVALITPSNEPIIGQMPAPSLSSVEVDYRLVGFRAARMLDLLMRGGRAGARHEVLEPAGVIPRDSTDHFAVEDREVGAAMRFIERNLSRKIRVRDVAAASSSRRTLERRFRSTCGRSIAAEIRRLRLLKAKRLLTESPMLIKQVARESGFGSPIRMHEAFVRALGIPPREFRRRAGLPPSARRQAAGRG